MFFSDPSPRLGKWIYVGKISCSICGFRCEIGRGIAVHTRRKHPSSYHAVKSPAAGFKARWDPEERYLLAKEEVRLQALNVWDIKRSYRLICLTEPLRQ
jgi:hypothetical protein